MFQLMFAIVMIMLANSFAFFAQVSPSGQVLFNNNTFERG